jgi:hypothetical protein
MFLSSKQGVDVVALGWTPMQSGFIFRQGARNYSPLHSVQADSGVHLAFYKTDGNRSLSSRVKRLGL